MPTRTITVTRDTGLHARPAREVSETARSFDADVMFAANDRGARATSPLELTALGVESGDPVTVSADGPEASEALDAIAAVLDGSTEEDPSAGTGTRGKGR